MTLSTTTRDLMAFLGRGLLALLFIPSGVQKITGFAGTVHYITAHHLPAPQLAAVVAIVIELGLGLALLVGYKTRWVSAVFIVYIVVLAFAFHAYWSDTPAQVMADQINFYKNLGLVGAFCSIFAWGPGDWSIDGRRSAATGHSWTHAGAA